MTVSFLDQLRFYAATPIAGAPAPVPFKCSPVIDEACSRKYPGGHTGWWIIKTYQPERARAFAEEVIRSFKN